MISLYTIITIASLHFLFDFKFQTRTMARNKSWSTDALMNHVMVYTFGLILMALFNYNSFGEWSSPVVLSSVFGFVFSNATLHWFTDWVTSKATTLLYKEERMGEFWDVIGFDQLCHTVALFSTFIYFTS